MITPTLIYRYSIELYVSTECSFEELFSGSWKDELSLEYGEKDDKKNVGFNDCAERLRKETDFKQGRD